MTKLDWDKTNAEKRGQRQGHEGVFMLEMPPTWNELVAGMVPPGLRELMFSFARSVILADHYESDPPEIPAPLQYWLNQRIKRAGGVLPFARKLLDPDSVISTEQKKLKRKLAILEKALLHLAAKCELGLINMEGLIPSIPDHLTATIIDRDTLLNWARSQAVYHDIVVQKQKGTTKKRAKRKRLALSSGTKKGVAKKVKKPFVKVIKSRSRI